MKTFNKLLALIFFVVVNFSLTAQMSDEDIILKLNSDFDKASLAGDLSFFETALAPEFISYHSEGGFSTRDEFLSRAKKEKETPTFKFLNFKSEDVKVKMAGNLAFITGQWKVTTKGLAPNSVSHDDTGRYIAVFEKRDGKWLMTSDMSTEKVHTAEELEPSLRKASEDFDKAIKNNDADLYSSLLAEGFTSVNSEGQMRNKAEELASFKSPDLKITVLVSDEKKFNIHRSTAVETGRYSVTGTYKGQAFSESGRYSSTWFYNSGRWVMASEHTSDIK